jgi:hypothetical protein
VAVATDHKQSSTSQSDEQKFAPLFADANKKIEKLESEASGRKSQIDSELVDSKIEIVKKLAQDLEEAGFRTEGIANEIVHQLEGKISATHIRKNLDNKYKDESHSKNAAKKGKPKVATPVLRTQDDPVSDQEKRPNDPQLQSQDPPKQQTTSSSEEDTQVPKQKPQIMVTTGGGHENTPPSSPTNAEHRDSPPSEQIDPVSEGLDAKPQQQHQTNEQGATDFSNSEGSGAKESQSQLKHQQQKSQQPQPSSSTSQSRQDFKVWTVLDKVEELHRKGLEKVAELRHKNIKNVWLCVRIENDKLPDMILKEADANERLE